MTLLQQILPQFMIKICEFLATPLLLPYIQVWTLIHILSGFLLIYLVRKQKYPLLVLLELLILFEMFEWTISYGWEFLAGTPIILKELFWDSFLDVVFGFLGGLVGYFIFRDK